MTGQPSKLLRIAHALDPIAIWSGKLTAWLILPMVLSLAYEVTAAGFDEGGGDRHGAARGVGGADHEPAYGRYGESADGRVFIKRHVRSSA